MSRAIRFGTDGVRGAAGQWPIDEAGAFTMGAAVAAWAHQGPVVIGQDTRASSPELCTAAARGLVAGGSTVLQAGVLPTAAVSCAVVANRAAAGIMITASHNPWTDNGLKVVCADGTKPEDASKLEKWMATPPQPGGGQVRDLVDPTQPWRAALPQIDLSGVRILLDCANGAAAPHGPGVLRAMGAEISEVGCTPNGHNINDQCGATHPPTDTNGCDLAICLDGDADRLVMVDRTAGLLDGDDLLWLLSRGTTGPVIGTVMTNGGLESALGDRLVRVAVGDKHVAQAMKATSAPVGGEPSGHILFSDGLPTGDGLYAALRILSQGFPLPQQGWTRLPQEHRNVRNPRPIEQLSAPEQARAEGLRVIVRPSGTEPVVRVMVEGPTAQLWADRIAEELQS